MGDFFHGWRRKIGVATLVMACVFMAGWARSYTILDGLLYSPAHMKLNMFSTIGKLSLSIQIDGKLKRAPFHWFRRPPAPASHRIPDDPFQGPFSTRWSLLGFEFKKMAEFPYPIWTVPYWSIVLPLTLLSAYLLLVKLRKPIQKKTTEPIANEGA